MRAVAGVLPVLVCLGLPLAVAAQPAQEGQRATQADLGDAQVAAQRVLLLRVSGSVPAPVAARVDRALATVLVELGMLVTSSPLPFQDAQLVAGCTGSVRQCGRQVAAALESERLAVALLDDEASVRLYVFESGGAGREGVASLPRAPDASLEPTLRSLVAQVFGFSPPAPRAVAEPAAQAVSRAPEEVREARSPRLRMLGWTTLGVGGALLAGALGTSFAAQSASRAYADSEVRSRDEADRALAHYESARRSANAAQVLWGAAAGAIAAGTFMLLWQRWAAPKDRNLQPFSAGGRSVRVAAVPARSGVSFALSGEL